MSGDPVAFSNTSAVDICSCVYLITCQALHSPTFRPHAQYVIEFTAALEFQISSQLIAEEPSLKDIRLLLEKKNPELLQQIYAQKKQALEESEKELKALELFLKFHNINAACEQVDYDHIGQAMQEQLPGFFGYYFMHPLPSASVRLADLAFFIEG